MNTGTYDLTRYLYFILRVVYAGGSDGVHCVNREVLSVIET